MSADPGEPLIRFENVSVSYWLRQGIFKRRKHYALRNVSFDIHAGDSLGVIGRNGSGKSTLLRLLAGVMTPDEGRIIRRDGLRVSLLSLQLGFVNYLTGRENVILSATLLGMQKREIESKMDDIIAFSELAEFIDEPIAAYSAGMRARLGFAVAFELEPDILLVDEVLGVGDAEFRHKSMSHMRARIQDTGSTVVFVSHMSGQVRSFCSKAIWLDQGGVEQAGAVDDVMDAYEDTVVETELLAGNASKPSFFRHKDAKKVYMLVRGKVRILRDYEEFVSMGGRIQDVQVVGDSVFESLVNRQDD